MSLETVVYRITNDAEFAKAMGEDPIATLRSHGIDLHFEELQALETTLNALGDSKPVKVAPDNPIDWYAPQFKGITRNPIDWYDDQFYTEIA